MRNSRNSGDGIVVNTTESLPVSSLELLDQLVDVATLTRDQITDVLAEFDLTESLAGMMWMLDPERDPVPMRELARRLRCDPSNVTLMGTKLERAGLVERRPHPTDGRVRTLALTPQGQQVWERLAHRLRSTSPVLSLTPAEQQQLGTLLEKVRLASRRPAPERS